MNKKIIFILAIIFIITFILFWKFKMPTNDGKFNTEFKVYELPNIKMLSPESNLIFLDDIDGTGKVELKVKEGFEYSFNKAGEHTIKVLELTYDYIMISVEGLAPTKNTGGFSLIEKYDKIKIEKNTGVCLNIQATDLYDGSVYFFYVN